MKRILVGQTAHKLLQWFRADGHRMWWSLYVMVIVCDGHRMWWSSYVMVIVCDGHCMWWSLYVMVIDCNRHRSCYFAPSCPSLQSLLYQLCVMHASGENTSITAHTQLPRIKQQFEEFEVAPEMNNCASNKTSSPIGQGKGVIYK